MGEVHMYSYTTRFTQYRPSDTLQTVVVGGGRDSMRKVVSSAK